MKRIHLLIIILTIALAYKLVAIKIDRDYYRIENDLYEEIEHIYQSIENQNNIIDRLIP